jgi:hypothetical protein
MEVKWARSPHLDIDRDVEKLTAYSQHEHTSHAFICIFGTKSCISSIKLPTDKWKERGKMVIADLEKTRYGCRIYELKNTETNSAETTRLSKAG